jgi:hypothetical protein
VAAKPHDRVAGKHNLTAVSQVATAIALLLTPATPRTDLSSTEGATQIAPGTAIESRAGVVVKYISRKGVIHMVASQEAELFGIKNGFTPG